MHGFVIIYHKAFVTYLIKHKGGYKCPSDL